MAAMLYRPQCVNFNPANSHLDEYAFLLLEKEIEAIYCGV